MFFINLLTPGVPRVSGFRIDQSYLLMPCIYRTQSARFLAWQKIQTANSGPASLYSLLLQLQLQNVDLRAHGVGVVLVLAVHQLLLVEDEEPQ